MTDASSQLRPARVRLSGVSILAAALVAFGCATVDGGGRDAAEQANIQVVDDFIAAWADPDRAVGYLAENASVRMIEDQPPVVGRRAIGEAFKGFLTPGVSLKVETRSTSAYGPVVMNERIDTLVTTGKPDQVFPVVGVFVVKNGKITEWTDYLDR